MRCIGVALAAAALALVPAASGTHLATPESALFNRGTIYVSLIGAFGANDGSIVKVDATGKGIGALVQASDIAPLADPKGMAVVGSTLWVTDVTVIRSYDGATGAPGRVIDLSASARFLNDLAVDKRGNLWVSDSQGNALYRVAPGGAAARIALPSRFAAPNGLAVHPMTGELWFATAPGVAGQAEVARRTASGKYAVVKTHRQFTGLDGLAFVGKVAYFSDFQTGAVWKLAADGKLTKRTQLAGGPADLSYAPTLKRLLVPLLRAGHFTTLKP